MLNNMQIVIVVLVLIIIWLGFLTLRLWRQQTQFQTLSHGAEGKNIEEILQVLIKDVRTAQKEVRSLATRTEVVEREGKLHMQKIGLLRFNPFNDTGGDQSFILALVDAENSGVVISGLYSRSGTRWYAKRVHNGKGTEHSLSDEEKKALDLAKTS